MIPGLAPEGFSPEVSVVIVNLNGRRWLGPCLAAVAAQKGPTVEVIVVDNASVDGSAAFIGRQFPWVRVVALERNLGFAGGNNAGARIASGRFLAFLNNDTVADPDWLRSLHGALEANPQAGLATSRIVYARDPGVLDSAGDGYTRAGGAFKRGHGEPEINYHDAGEVFGACGAAFMIRKELFEELGGFDEDFFLVYEDVDLSYRAQLLDHRCVYVPEALVIHSGSATLGTASALAVFHGQRNLEWVYVKNTPWQLLLRTFPGHVVYVAAAALHFGRSGHFIPYLRAKWAALRGLPGVLVKRRVAQRSRRARLGVLWGLMERRWLSLKWREKRFDRRAAGSRGGGP
ncbi:MAG: glycosyltransferase family 2 protein [Acidobacteriota bacterium]